MQIDPKKLTSFDDLIPFGFEYIDHAEPHGDEEPGYVLEGHIMSYYLGHSRRGQMYYLLVDEALNIRLYASPPDGGGGSLLMPDVLIRLHKAGLIKEGE